jgi:hypothetical protein
MLLDDLLQALSVFAVDLRYGGAVEARRLPILLIGIPHSEKLISKIRIQYLSCSHRR